MSVEPIDRNAAGKVKARMPRQRVIELLGPPLLAQASTEPFPRGCIFYPNAKGRLANVWQFCFDQQGVSLVLTAYATAQPPPPEDASPVREALLARADTVCQSEYGHLAPINARVSDALAAFGKSESRANRQAVARQISRFIDNLDVTYDQLAAYQAPKDGLDSLTAYLGSLKSQSEGLTEARTAFLDGDMQAYKELGTKFNEIGRAAKQQAKDYGFSYCSASSFN